MASLRCLPNRSCKLANLLKQRYNKISNIHWNSIRNPVAANEPGRAVYACGTILRHNNFQIDILISVSSSGSMFCLSQAAPTLRRIYGKIEKVKCFCTMEKVFINHAYPCNAASVSENLERLHALLSQAAAQAAGSGKAVLASLILPVPASDPLRVFRALQTLYPGACSYWEQPAHQTSLVGASAALSIQTSGTRHFADSALAWQQLRDTAMVLYTPDSPQNQASPLHGPTLFGGFSFDPLRVRTPLWRGFSHGLVFFPPLLFRPDANQATLTLNCPVHATHTLYNLTHAFQHETIPILALLDIIPRT